MPSASLDKERVVVLGGGIAGLAAAYELSKDSRYEITVYQQGWLLGGKGASVRNEKYDYRIEEHGLHIWMGWYDNAFEMLGQCYDSLGRSPDHVLPTLDAAFQPHDLIGLAETDDDTWEFWLHRFAEHSGRPGTDTADPSAWDYLLYMFESLVAWLHDPGEVQGELPHAHILPLLGSAELLAFLETLHLARRVAGEADLNDPSPMHRRLVDSVVDGVEAYVRWAHGVLGHPAQRNAWLRHYLIVADFAAAVARGLVHEGIVFGSDWASIDDVEAREFLRRHGAQSTTLDSALVRGCYNLSFCHKAGAGAGTSLLGIFRMMLSYRGHVFYRMAAGMGEVVFVPLYQALKKRGVRFEFFHRVDALHVDAASRTIASIDVARQVELNGAEYDPLETLELEIDGRKRTLEYWPRRPRADQIKTAIPNDIDCTSWWCGWQDVEKRQLKAGTDFEHVVLAISVGALPAICNELAAANPAWQLMLDNVKTTPTASAQLWLEPTLDALGWDKGSAVIGGAKEPMDTWADMSHLIRVENAPRGSVGHIAYFCSPLEENEQMPSRGVSDYPQRQHERVCAETEQWIEEHARQIWPHGRRNDGGFDSKLLRDPDASAGGDPMQRQYFRANLNPSDRYVLSVAGSTKFRLRPDGSGFRNLVLAGDWTRLPLSAGCIESTVDSGIAAAAAIRAHYKAQAVSNENTRRIRMGRIARPRIGPLLRGGAASLEPVEEVVATMARAAENTVAAAFTQVWSTTVAARPAVARERTAGLQPGTDDLPEYVTPPGMVVPPGPYLMSDVTMYSFVIAAELAPLQALFDRQLNALGAGVHYKPFHLPAMRPRIIVSFADIGRMTSTDADQLGTMSERDLIFWVPTLGSGRSTDGVHPAPFSWYCPYVWVDSGAAVSTGREVYGFPKTDAGFSKQPQEPRKLDRLRIEALAIEKKGEHATRIPLIEIQRVWPTFRGTLVDEPTIWTKTGDVVVNTVKLLTRAMDRLEPDNVDGGILDRFAGLLTGTQWMLFLKQFRDAEDPRRACCQQIIEAPAEVVSFPVAGPLWGRYSLRITETATCDLAQSFGLPTSTDIPVLGAFWSSFDFRMSKAKRIWGRP